MATMTWRLCVITDIRLQKWMRMLDSDYLNNNFWPSFPNIEGSRTCPTWNRRHLESIDITTMAGSWEARDLPGAAPVDLTHVSRT